MRGPIDYIIVGFEGNKFDGSILRAIGDAIDKGVILRKTFPERRYLLDQIGVVG